MTNNNNLNSIPYAKWLEKCLQDIIKFPVKGMCICALTDRGEAYTNYYEFSMMDKLTIAGLINQDATLDALAANGFIEYSDDDGDAANGEEKE